MSEPKSYKDQVIWITGASSGIGQALALEFASEGAKLVLSSRSEASLLSAKKQCDQLSGQPNNTLVLPLDVTDEAGLDDKVAKVMSWAGRIDMLINNAGISQRSSCVNTTMEAYRTVFEVDVFGQIALTKAVLPIMLKQKSGHFSVTSSVSGKMGVPFRTGYCAAKHAVMGFFDALRTEVEHQGISVTTITPGYVRTSISKNAITGDGQPYGLEDSQIKGGMDVNECAKVIMRGFRKKQYEIAVGKGPEMHALWIKRFFPKTLFKLAAKQYSKMANSNKLS